MDPRRARGATFRKHYLQIATMLMLSTLIVLSLMGIVYVQLRAQLERDGQTSLTSERLEVQDLLKDQLAHNTNNTDAELSDERGQNVYFIASTPHAVVFQSSPQPIPARILDSLTHHHTFAEVEYAGNPYRVYQSTWSYQSKTYNLFIYKLISQEVQTMHHVRDLMMWAGSAGIAFTVGINLWIAYLALSPARRTWRAHQEMMVELSHELQTPLATIQATVSSSQVDAHVRERILVEVGSASSMVRDILYLSNLQAQIVTQSSEPVAVSDLTEEVVERFRSLASARHIQLTGRAMAGLYVNTTSERWSRLVSTILKNVVDHAASHSEAAWSLSPHGHWVEFRMVNVRNGMGRKANLNRKGLGLVIAERLVQDMEGNMAMTLDGETLQTVIRVPLLKSPRL